MWFFLLLAGKLGHFIRDTIVLICTQYHPLKLISKNQKTRNKVWYDWLQVPLVSIVMRQISAILSYNLRTTKVMKSKYVLRIRMKRQFILQMNVATPLLPLRHTNIGKQLFDLILNKLENGKRDVKSYWLIFACVLT